MQRTRTAKLLIVSVLLDFVFYFAERLPVHLDSREYRINTRHNIQFLFRDCQTTFAYSEYFDFIVLDSNKKIIWISTSKYTHTPLRSTKKFLFTITFVIHIILNDIYILHWYAANDENPIFYPIFVLFFQVMDLCAASILHY